MARQLDDILVPADGKKVLRQQQIITILQAQHFLALEDIARAFSVTTQTARRDLIDLEEAGTVRRLHGGAILAHPVIDPPTYRSRRVERVAAKTAIAAKVAAMIPNGSTLFLDTGTTCEAVAKALIHHRDLRVVTYSLRSATTLSEQEHITVAVPGGFVRHIDGGVFGHGAVEFIRGFSFDAAVISVSSINERGDMCDDDYGEIEMVRTAMGVSERSILAVDSSKFLRRALVCLGPVSDVDVIVTDAPPPETLAPALSKTRIELAPTAPE